MENNNGSITNYDLLQELHDARMDQSTNLSRLEQILQTGFANIATELQELRKVFQNGFLKTINILCYCLVAIIMWVTAIKTLPQIFGVME
jgi:hypothetical protein